MRLYKSFLDLWDMFPSNLDENFMRSQNSTPNTKKSMDKFKSAKLIVVILKHFLNYLLGIFELGIRKIFRKYAQS